MPTRTHPEPSSAPASENPPLSAACSFPESSVPGKTEVYKIQDSRSRGVTEICRKWGFVDLDILGEKIRTLEKKLGFLWWACDVEIEELVYQYSETKKRDEYCDRHRR